jgi:release factor glutamine methyltransferase
MDDQGFMTLKELQHHFHEQLNTIYGKNEISSLFKLVMEHYLNLKSIDLALHPKHKVSNTALDHIIEAINRLKLEEPIQYIIGETEFFGMLFKVNPFTLIPRPETEELVQWIIEDLSIPKAIGNKSQAPNPKHLIPTTNNQQPTTNNQHLTILYIGTGSGCIAVSLAKHLPNAKVYAMDISQEALKIAEDNAKLNEVAVNFIEADILDSCHAELPPDVRAGVSEFHKFDIIVSNPPYVRELEKSQIKNNVLKHEPHLALFVKNEDPLLFYKAICEFAVHNLKPKGNLYFEINQYLGGEMKQLLNSYNFESVEIRKDMFGNVRMLKSIKP